MSITFLLPDVGYIVVYVSLRIPARSDDCGGILPHTTAVTVGMPPGTGTWSPQWGWYVSMTPPQVSKI